MKLEVCNLWKAKPHLHIKTVNGTSNITSSQNSGSSKKQPPRQNEIDGCTHLYWRRHTWRVMDINRSRYYRDVTLTRSDRWKGRRVIGESLECCVVMLGCRGVWITAETRTITRKRCTAKGGSGNRGRLELKGSTVWSWVFTSAHLGLIHSSFIAWAFRF